MPGRKLNASHALTVWQEEVEEVFGHHVSQPSIIQSPARENGLVEIRD